MSVKWAHDARLHKGETMFRKLTVLAALGALAFATPANAAGSFTVDQPPQVGVTSTFDSTALCPTTQCSYTTSVTYTNQVKHTTVTIRQLGQTPVVEWTPTVLDASHGYVTVVVKVGRGGGTNNFTVYQQTYVVIV